MKKTNDIDQLFQAKLQNHTVTPPPAVWNKLEKELAKKQTKKRQGGIYWKAAAGIAVAVGVSLWAWQLQNPETATNVVTTAKSNIRIVTPKNNANRTTTNDTALENATVAQNSAATKPETMSQHSQNHATNKLTKANNGKNTMKNSTVATVKQLAGQQEELVQVKTLQTPNNNEEKVVDEGIANNDKVPTENTVVAVENPQITDNVEIIVKIMPSPKNSETASNEENAETATPKRKGLGRIWNKLRDGELLTLQDVGINKEKLPRFLKREQ